MNHVIEIEVDNATVKGFLLCVAVEAFCNEIKSKITGYLSGDISSQIDCLFFPFQQIAGSESDFSFAVYVLPRLTIKQRQAMEYKDYCDLKVELSEGVAFLTIDGFGQINGIRIFEGVRIYHEINDFSKSMEKLIWQ